MSGVHDNAVEALKALLWELPAEFSQPPGEVSDSRDNFMVIKKSNVRKVHRALWELQEYFDINQ